MTEAYLGPRGMRKDFFLKIKKIMNFPQYDMHLMEDREGRVAMFYKMKLDKKFKGDTPIVGDCILMTATIAEHRNYNGEPQSYLNRIVVKENKGGATKEDREKATTLVEANKWSYMSASSFNTQMGSRPMHDSNGEYIWS